MPEVRVGYGLPLTEGEFNDLIRIIEDSLRRLEELSGQIVDRVNDALRWLGPLAEDTRQVLQRFVDLMRRFFSEVGKFFTRWGVPWTLYHHGTTWTEQVGGPAHALVTQADTGQLGVDDYWTGPAATAYTGVVPLQSKALAAIKAATDELDDALMKTAGGIIAFWLGIAAALVPFVVEQAAAALAALGVLTAPAAAAGSAASAAKTIGIVLAVVTAAITYLTTLYTQIRDLDQRFHNSDGLPGGSWPRLASDISNGRVHHGSTLDWNIKS
jgi:hypothetical protein